MAEIRVTAQSIIDGSADDVYGFIANMTTHQQFLPAAFSDFQIESGGVGAGTVTRFAVTAGGRTRHYRMVIDEPHPGRVLAEHDSDSSLVTTFTVAPIDERALVTISTSWQGASGIGGFFERRFAPRAMRAIYQDELNRLNNFVHDQADKP